MAGTLVEYVRFVEVQRRRARVAAQLTQPLDALVVSNGTTAAVDRPIDVDKSPAPVDTSPTHGSVDVR
jgi:hypothetical protein